MTKFQVGDRVRCVNQSRFKGREGTIVGITTYGYYKVRWEDEPADSTQGGTWSDEAIEPVDTSFDDPIDERIEVLIEDFTALIRQKDAALRVAAFVFGQYAENHFAKGTPESIMKAITNVGLEGMMLDALEAD